MEPGKARLSRIARYRPGNTNLLAKPKTEILGLTFTGQVEQTTKTEQGNLHANDAFPTLWMKKAVSLRANLQYALHQSTRRLYSSLAPSYLNLLNKFQDSASFHKKCKNVNIRTNTHSEPSDIYGICISGLCHIKSQETMNTPLGTSRSPVESPTLERHKESKNPAIPA